MSLTVDIDKREMKKVMRMTGWKKKSAAVADYLRLRRVDRLMRRVCEGKVGYGRTNEELELMVGPGDAHH